MYNCLNASAFPFYSGDMNKPFYRTLTYTRLYSTVEHSYFFFHYSHTMLCVV